MATFASPVKSLMVILAACSGPLQAQTVSLSGPTQVRFGATAQYSAVVSGVSKPTIVWSVNGTVHGASATGAISATGLYSPASTIFAGHSVTIGASNSGSAASLNVKILNPLPVLASGSVTAEAQPGSYLVDVHGSGFMSTSQLQISGADVAFTFISATELESTISLAAGTTTVEVGVLNPNAAQNAPVTRAVAVPALPLASLTESARLLDQTTFGPTLSAIQHVQLIGAAAYLNQQFAIPTTRMPAIPNPPVALCPDATFRCAQSSFWKNALTANDQLRQRVAFALSEIFVVSTDEVNARTIPSYHNLLADDAFGSFRQVMNDVATSPAMGAYLNMLDSGTAPAGQIANENFARNSCNSLPPAWFCSTPTAAWS